MLPHSCQVCAYNVALIVTGRWQHLTKSILQVAALLTYAQSQSTMVLATSTSVATKGILNAAHLKHNCCFIHKESVRIDRTP